MPRSRRTGAVLVAATVLLLALAGCTTARDSPTVTAPSAGVPSSSARATSSAPTATPTAVARHLARFDAVNRRTVARVGSPGGRDFIDALVAAGFRKADMQVTEDRTTIDLPVPSVQFSVLLHGVCLIGQHGPMSGGYRGVAGEPVDGRCLIGRTRAIDW